MKRLMIATAILLTTTATWGQASMASDTLVESRESTASKAPRLTNCSDKRTLNGCSSTAGSDAKSERLPIHQMMNGGTMSGYVHPGGQDAISASSPE